MRTLEELKAAPGCAVGEVETVMARMLHSASVEVTGPHDDTGGTVSITLYCWRDPRLVAKPDIYGNIKLTPELLRFCAGLPDAPAQALETCATCVHGRDLDIREGSMVVCGPQRKAHDREYRCSGYRRVTANELAERVCAKMGVQRGS